MDIPNRFTVQDVAAKMVPGQINPYLMGCIISQMIEFGAQPPSVAAAQEIFEKDLEIVSLNAYYPMRENDTLFSMDTQDYEEVARVVAEHFVGRPWPMFGNGKEYSTKFKADLKIALVQSGWVYSGD